MHTGNIPYVEKQPWRHWGIGVQGGIREGLGGERGLRRDMEACSNIMRKGNRNMRACWGERGLLEHKGDKSTGTSEDVSTQSGVGSSDLVFSTVF